MAMSAVLVALEGLTKEVARVRVRTAQLGDRGHTSDVRLTYVEDQVSRIKNKMKQLKVRPLSCPHPSCVDPHLRMHVAVGGYGGFCATLGWRGISALLPTVPAPLSKGFGSRHGMAVYPCSACLRRAGSHSERETTK